MIKSLFVVALLSILIEAQEYELLVQQDASQCFFDRTTIESTGNQGAPSDTCYSNIGTIANIKDDYRDENGEFTFRLTYYNPDVELVWSQTSWITDSVLLGADLSEIPNQSPYVPADGIYFHGLGRNKKYPDYSFLDGSPGDIHDYWWNGVVTFQIYGRGIPGFKQVISVSNKLEILVPEADCVMNTNEVCSEIELNTDRIDAANGRIDSIDGDLNGRIDTLSTTLNERIDAVDGDLNERIDTANGRIDTLRDYLQGADAAHAFNGDVITDNKNVFEFSKTELLLLGLNLITIVFGLFICWKGGLFSKNNKRGYAKVRQYYESDAVEKPINA